MVVFPHKEGAYAETYRVRDAGGKLRFLKLINYAKLQRHQFDNDGNVIEVEVTKLLNQQNLCKYVDSGSLAVNGQQLAYVVTEFISGETMDKRIQRDGQLSIYEVKQATKAVLEALKYLHSMSRPVIHNEVTIQNIMLNLQTGLDGLKLIDYGYSRFLDLPPEKSSLKGLNPFYLAPERFNGVCSVQTDLFAVGVVLYQLVYGSLPCFFDTSRMSDEVIRETLESHRERGLHLPSIEKFELDEQLKNIISL